MNDNKIGPAVARPARALAQVNGQPPVVPPLNRLSTRGKFLYLGIQKFWVRGVTYGTFRPGPDGEEYPADAALDADFAAMAAAGLNAVRTYTVPPRRLLDAALAHGLRVLVGLPWEQHVTFLDERHRARSIESRVRAGVRACAGHPAVLAFAVGNEIPAPIVRWHGRRRVERFLGRLCDAAREEDPRALVTYVNYPTTEYLELPGVDFVCFNVYLESPERYQAYLARLQNLAGDRPLVMAEIGLDSRRHGEVAQAQALAWQLRGAFAAGCAGAFVFAWTDEWYRGGFDIEDWDFGLTDRRRRPKPALAAVQKAMAEVPFPRQGHWPRVSVVVCSYNGARTIRQCLDGLQRLEYPDYEVIVVDDGSTDATAAIARRYPFRLISTPNRGLSAARNTGLAAATGEIVAYIDDDAYPDPHWLHYLAATLRDGRYAGAGGPNIPPPGDGLAADCVAHSPGGPIHVLLSDREAEHIPGCNMAFRRECLEAVGGFDPRFRTAGDDVDVCWRLQARGWRLGFHPAAVVWHHRRSSVRAYLRQQMGYGRAEALLEAKWPEKYNALGHAAWAGRLYGPAMAALARARGRVYHGARGAALFQSLYEPAPGLLSALVATPEWYLVVVGMALLSLLGALWPPLLAAVPLLAITVAIPVALAVRAAARARLGRRYRTWSSRLRARALIAWLWVAQPVARLAGRLRHGLTPWRRRLPTAWLLPVPGRVTVWSEHWRDPADWVHGVEQTLRDDGVLIVPGGDFDRWDLEVRGGLLGSARLLTAVEEHGAGRQLVRFRIWPVCRGAVVVSLVLAGLAVLAWSAGAAAAAAFLAAGAAGLAARAAFECGTATAALRRAAVVPARPAAAASDALGVPAPASEDELAAA